MFVFILRSTNQHEHEYCFNLLETNEYYLNLLEIGFPLDLDRNIDIHSTESNHKSTVEKIKVTKLCVVIFKKTFQLSYFPDHDREKQDSDKRRSIIDLSWPHNAPVNSGISKYSYLNTYFTLTYPSIVTGPGAQYTKLTYLGPS